MSRRQVIVSKDKPADPAVAQASIDALKALGLEPGQKIRFRSSDAGSWNYGTVRAMEKDGSIGLYSNGKFRSIRPTNCQIQETGPRGGIVWIALTKE